MDGIRLVRRIKATEVGTGSRHHAYAVGDADYHLPLLKGTHNE